MNIEGSIVWRIDVISEHHSNAKSFVSHGFQSFVEIHNLMAMMHD